MNSDYYSNYKRRSMKGFSLVEMVVAIVIMSIISIGLVRFILDSSQGYLNSANRNQLSAAGRMVIDRLSIELHNTLPNSIRITGAYTSASGPVLGGDALAGDQCIEFILVRAATTYINPPFRPRSSTTGFNVIDFVPDQDNVTDVYAAIYPIRTSEIYQGPLPVTGPVAHITMVNDMDTMDGINELDMDLHRFTRRSRFNRVFLTDQPVSYCVKGDRIYRYTNYGFTTSQIRPVDIGGACSAGSCLPSSTPNRVLITTLVDNAALTDAGSQAFDQLAATRRRNAVVQLEINFSKNGDVVLLNHEVLLQNTP